MFKKIINFIKENKLRSVLIFIIVLIVIVVTILSLPYAFKLLEEEHRLAFKNYLDTLGWFGVLLLILIQIVQIIIAFIPGEFVELLAGMMYGPWIGLLVCLIGALIGTFISYKLTLFLGKPLVATKKEQKQMEEYDFIKKEKRANLFFFVMFFIPATPKDVFNYIAPFTNIKFKNFLLIATFARIPTIITSTLLGASLIEGQFWFSLIIFLITLLFAIIGIVIHYIYIKKKKY